MSATATWWKDGTVYQIYPASYKDSNGDGLGDIPGIVSELDYISSLGVEIVWICPHYDSPQFDMGYDVSDYEKVYPPYGNMEDMEALIKGCHDRGLRIIVDLVINHTSHLHEWFKQSRSSKDNPYRDYYIWRPARIDKDGNRAPPTNWQGEFGGSVWEWDELTGEYYFHLFTPEQPDLNFENDDCRKAIYLSAMKFWLVKGVDGFRVDSVNTYCKSMDFNDAPITDPTSLWQRAPQYYANGVRMHEFLSEMNELLTEYDAMTVGELPHTEDRNKILKYVSAKEKQLNMVFLFEVVSVGIGKGRRFDTTPFAWRLTDLKRAILSEQQFAVGTDAWTTTYLENHDQARSVSRWASDAPEHRVMSGKLLAMLSATLSGTLFLYQGQEIGMINIPDSWGPADYKDVFSQNWINLVKSEIGNVDEAVLKKRLAGLRYLCRDNARTPMQWTADAPNAGFSSAEPWMRVNDSYVDINVKAQVGDPESVLEFWKKMIKLRKEHRTLFVYGHFEVVDADNQSVFTYTKTYEADKALVVLNFSPQMQPLPEVVTTTGELVLLAANAVGSQDMLKPYEGRVYKVVIS